ncbi:MAG: endolytic transglycosylase MltG [bacterium]
MRRKHRTGRTLLLGGIVGIVVLAGILLFPANLTKNFETREINVPKGASIEAIAAILQHEGLVGNTRLFVLAARVLGYDRNLQAGRFSIPVGSSTYRILHQLAKGMSASDMVTVPEGLRVEQIADILYRGAKIDPVRFLALSSDSVYVRTLGVPSNRIEGYLFPDTYPFYPLLSPQEVIRMMTERSLRVFGEEMAMPGAKLGLTLQQLVTLASIVEAEAQAPSERPRIAAVFYNRLRQGMMLQSDPTVSYAMGIWRNRIYYRDLDVKSPYNTYRNRGIPPGPICSPGRGAFHAVLFPLADSTELYFVARGDGTHIFSKSWEAHLRAIAMVRAQARPESTLVPMGPGFAREPVFMGPPWPPAGQKTGAAGGSAKKAPADPAKKAPAKKRSH